MSDILFYDGPCSLCNYTVSKVIKHSNRRGEQLKFASIDGKTALFMLPKSLITRPYPGIVLISSGHMSFGAEAVRNLKPFLRFPFSFLVLLMPSFIYQIISKNRNFISSRISLKCPLHNDNSERFLP